MALSLQTFCPTTEGILKTVHNDYDIQRHLKKKGMVSKSYEDVECKLLVILVGIWKGTVGFFGQTRHRYEIPNSFEDNLTFLSVIGVHISIVDLFCITE